MIIVQVAGGLGNQLQQYALYRKFLSLGKDAKLDLSWFTAKSRRGRVFMERDLELAYFDRLPMEVCTPREKARLIGPDGPAGKLKRKLFPGSVRWFHESRMYHSEIFGMEDMYLSGYFACEKYYGDILEDLRKEIRFPKSGNPLNQKMAQEMQDCNSVSIHIRRGDYLDKENIGLLGNICTEKYYKAAVRLIREQITDPHFYIFSDDAAYVREHAAGEDHTIVDINRGKDSFYDIWLMSHCRHNICANSTFSFWGARLNPDKGKIMIRPTIHRNNQTFVEDEMKELWKGWRFVSPEGSIIADGDRKIGK